MTNKLIIDDGYIPVIVTYHRPLMGKPRLLVLECINKYARVNLAGNSLMKKEVYENLDAHIEDINLDRLVKRNK